VRPPRPHSHGASRPMTTGRRPADRTRARCPRHKTRARRPRHSTRARCPRHVRTNLAGCVSARNRAPPTFMSPAGVALTAWARAHVRARTPAFQHRAPAVALFRMPNPQPCFTPNGPKPVRVRYLIRQRKTRAGSALELSVAGCQFASVASRPSHNPITYTPNGPRARTPTARTGGTPVSRAAGTATTRAGRMPTPRAARSPPQSSHRLAKPVELGLRHDDNGGGCTRARAEHTLCRSK
jgi:hypothetical protein